MNSILIDTSYTYINIYIINNSNVLISERLSVKKDMSNKILPLIRKLLVNVNLKINDINKLFVTVGPGSFTGIRIGVTVAKTISCFLKIPLIPISTLEFLASVNTKKKKIIPIIDARRGNVFTATYDNELNILKEEKLIPLNNINVDDDTIIVSYDGFANSKKIAVDVIKLINKHKLDQPINPHKLVPNYLKKTEAEENLNVKNI